MLAQNKKIKKSGNNDYVVYNFGIPAFISQAGIKTCPLAGTCAKGCYAKQGAYVWSNVSQAYEKRLESTLKQTFITEMDKLIKTKHKNLSKQNKKLVIRIHDSGDFYNRKYLNKWLEIIKSNPEVIFYAYTKMIPLFKSVQLPSNFIVIYSEGGQRDDLINSETDRHARVFPSKDELIKQGYSDASENDLVACLGPNHKIGLVYHGAKSKNWATN